MIFKEVFHRFRYLDILITGRNDAEHLCNLEEVIRRLKGKGVTGVFYVSQENP